MSRRWSGRFTCCSPAFLAIPPSMVFCLSLLRVEVWRFSYGLLGSEIGLYMRLAVCCLQHVQMSISSVWFFFVLKSSVSLMKLFLLVLQGGLLWLVLQLHFEQMRK